MMYGGGVKYKLPQGQKGHIFCLALWVCVGGGGSDMFHWSLSSPEGNSLYFV